MIWDIMPIYIKHGSTFVQWIEAVGRMCFFCASSDENIHKKPAAVLAQAAGLLWIIEEHRDNAGTKFWRMSCSRE